MSLLRKGGVADEGNEEYFSAVVAFGRALVDARDYSRAEETLQAVLPRLEKEDDWAILLASALISLGAIRGDQGKWLEGAGE